MATSCLDPSGLDCLTLSDCPAVALYICFCLLQKESSLISQDIYLFILMFLVGFVLSYGPYIIAS